MINILQTESAEVTIPDWVLDLESFCRWVDAEDVPEKARISYLEDKVWVDMSKEQVFSHVLVKTKLCAIGCVVEAGQLGLFLADGVRLTNIESNFSVRPDGTFVSQAKREAKEVRLVEGIEEGFLELEGTPDMVLEVVSSSSVRKDKVLLRKAYWEAGIGEYWLVDARKDPLSFDILRHTPKGYVAVRKQDGWLRSGVFGKSFRLTRRADPLGQPDFLLEMR
jgi:Putative restriction endonuclease